MQTYPNTAVRPESQIKRLSHKILTEITDDWWVDFAFAGTIAEREHSKWEKATPLTNNPYSPENIEKRRYRSMFSSRSSSEASLQWVYMTAYYKDRSVSFKFHCHLFSLLFSKELEQRKRYVWAVENRLQSVSARYATVICSTGITNIHIYLYLSAI